MDAKSYAYTVVQVLPESSFYGTALNRLKCRRPAVRPPKIDAQAPPPPPQGHEESVEKDVLPAQLTAADTERALGKRLDELTTMIARLSAGDLRQSQPVCNDVFAITERIGERVEAALRRENEMLRASLEAKVDPLSRIADRVEATLRYESETLRASLDAKVDPLSTIPERVDATLRHNHETLYTNREPKVDSLSQITERVDMAVQRESAALRETLEAKVDSLAQITERVDMALHRESETLRATIEAKADSLTRLSEQVKSALQRESATIRSTLEATSAPLERLDSLLKAADHKSSELVEESLRDTRKHIEQLEEVARGLAERHDRFETRFNDFLRCEIAALEEKRQVEHDTLKSLIERAATHSSLNVSLDSLEAKLSALIAESQSQLKSLISKAMSNEGAVIAVPLENTVATKCATPLHPGADDLVSSLEVQDNNIVSSLDQNPLTGMVRRAATALDRRVSESPGMRPYSHDTDTSVPASVLDLCDRQKQPAQPSTPVKPNRLSAFIDSFSMNDGDSGKETSQRNFRKDGNASLPQPLQTLQSDETAPTNRLSRFLASFTESSSRNHPDNPVAGY